MGSGHEAARRMVAEREWALEELSAR